MIHIISVCVSETENERVSGLNIKHLNKHYIPHTMALTECLLYCSLLLYLVQVTFMSSYWQKSLHLICYVTTITAKGWRKKDKNHMNHLGAQDMEKDERIYFVKQKQSWKAKAHLHMGASRSFRGADSLCSLSIFTTRQQEWVPWPWKETQMCFSLAMLIKIQLLWRCYAIIASDCSADTIAPV